MTCNGGKGEMGKLDSNKKVIIRCDANKEIATGHMKRCQAIAEELEKLGMQVIFAVASRESIDYLDTSKKYIVFNNNYNEYDIEEEKMIAQLIAEKPDVLLVDSYSVTPKYLDSMRKYTRVAYIDDLYERVWPVDIIINYGIIADTYPYGEDYKAATQLLGPKYMPINKVYRNAVPNVIKEKAENVLIVSGGSDEEHFMKNLLLKLLLSDDNGLNYTFICGYFNTDYDEMEEIVKKVRNITILKSLPSLVNIIGESDIIVSAGGTTLYEMALMGCPGIVYKLADNQTENIKGFVNKEIALYAGDVRNYFSYDNLVNTISELAKDYEKRKQLSNRGKEIIDAYGARRLAEGIINS